MNKEKLQAKIKNHQSEIGKLELAIKELDTPRYPFIPKVDEVFYVVSFDGGIVSFKRGSCSDLHFQYRRIFRTKAEAKTWIKVQERINALEEVLEPLDWDDEHQGKNYLRFNHKDGKFRLEYNWSVQYQGTAHTHESTARTIIKEFSTNELRVWAGV